MGQNETEMNKDKTKHKHPLYQTHIGDYCHKRTNDVIIHIRHFITFFKDH